MKWIGSRGSSNVEDRRGMSGGGLATGGAMLGRLIAGMILKWVVIVGGLLVVLVHWKLPPLAALAGLAAAFAVNLLAFRFKG